MSKKLSMDIGFMFEMSDGSTRPSCGACRRRYQAHDVPVPFSGWRGAEYGKEYADDGVLYFYGHLCGDCLLSSPAELAAKIRARAEKIRPRQRKEAERLIEFAGELEKVGDLRDLPGGVMAVKIGEAYRELDNPRKGKAA